ncbi:MAG: ATP-binding cassette domain-containing protein, partial [Candidatus Dormiibacterota bacterium]
MTPDPARLAVEHLSYAYPGSPLAALRDIDLVVEPGEFVLLAGASGCGKSTLALALAGLIPNRIPGRVSGQVRLGSRTLAGEEQHVVSQLIGIVFQNPDDQLIHPVVDAEIAFGPENLGLPAEEVRCRVEQALALTGMTARRRTLTFALSGGEKQRVAIAATLAMQPGVLILDEPCSDLDPIGAQQVLGVLHDLNRRLGMTVILVEHRIDEVIPWVDRVLLMGEGTMRLERPAREAFADTAPWTAEGVAVPETVRLAQGLPDVFGAGLLPLSSGEAADALRGTPYGAALAGSATSPRPGSAPVPGSGRSVLRWRNVELAFGSRLVLAGLDLEVRAGEWVALAGPNGSGKTSLAGLAMGLQAPTAGSVEVRGRAVDRRQPSRQAALVSYLFQSADTMLFSRTVLSELTFAARWGRRRVEASVLDAIIDVIGLGTERNRDPFSLSHGQRERLALGALLATATRAMILDEPTTGQDEAHAAAFLGLLERIRRDRQATYLMITHDMRAVAARATRLVVLSGGRVALDGHPSCVFAHRDELGEAHIVAPPMA